MRCHANSVLNSFVATSQLIDNAKAFSVYSLTNLLARDTHTHYILLDK